MEVLNVFFPLNLKASLAIVFFQKADLKKNWRSHEKKIRLSKQIKFSYVLNIIKNKDETKSDENEIHSRPKKKLFSKYKLKKKKEIRIAQTIWTNELDNKQVKEKKWTKVFWQTE